jgi:hypothetical protein
MPELTGEPYQAAEACLTALNAYLARRDGSDDEPEDWEREMEAEKQAMAALDPWASEPVHTMQLKLHPSFFQNFSLGWSFAASKDTFYIISGSEGIWRFPEDCIKEVTVEEASAGISTEAIVSKVLDPLFNQHPMRVRVDLHVWLHWVPNSGNMGIQDFNGVSFEVSDEQWAKTQHVWTALANRAFPSGPRCPACRAYALVGQLTTFSQRLGGGHPPMRATCGECGKNFDFDAFTGRFRPPAP